MKVFVYGTLKKGYGNNYLLSSSTLLCEDIVEGFELKYHGYPVAKANADAAIHGEVWDIGDCSRTLSNLDWLEGVPVLYTREVVTTKGGHECSMYVGNPDSFDFSRMDGCRQDENGIHFWEPRRP